ncbi:MAG: phytanoyl-CoA dioxygenase family protein [Gammaproteobacteria bacterium]|nr:phytanoyl-CoA dioxygenase family protein [Gammaproteobacteria bacterium]
MLSHAQIQQFKIDGYLVIPEVFAHSEIKALRETTTAHLGDRIEPFELESAVQYPGAPQSTTAAGGDTIRRLKLAFQRHSVFKKVAETPEIVDSIAQILGGKQLYLNPNHHNCIMTKLPEFSSETHWHRDTRYWNFDNKYLVNAWVALGDERQDNGCMKILPGSHRWEVRREALDEAQFLLPDHPDNAGRLDTQRLVELNAGDLLLFSAHCFHAAGKNRTSLPKFSLVYTFHNEETHPIKGSNSSHKAEVRIR